VIDEQSVAVFMNGLQYPFAYTNAAGVIFHTNGTTPTGSGAVPLYFDATDAGFAIATDDYITIKYLVIT
jgi:hypothetical protein